MSELRYTAEHEWVSLAEGGTVARVGITDVAQKALGDIVFVSVPEVGSRLKAGEPCGEVESTKSVSEIYAPLSGEVVASNIDLDSAPELVNAEPFGAGWIFEVRVDDVAAVSSLLTEQAYRELAGS